MLKLGAEIFVYLFFFLSFFGCCLVLALYASLPKIRLAFGKTVIHVTVLYLLEACFFFVSVQLELNNHDSYLSPNHLCIFTVYVLYYCMMCHIFWVNNLIIKVHLSVRQLVTPGRARRLSEIFYIAYGYGVPALLVIMNQVIFHVVFDRYVVERGCALDLVHRFVFYFPFVFIIGIVNSVLCGITDCTLRRCQREGRQDLKKIQRMSYLGLSAFLMGLFSEFLIFLVEGFVSFNVDTSVAVHFMTILQGFIFSMQLIFLCHWEEIRAEFKEGRFCWIKGADQGNSASLTELADPPQEDGPGMSQNSSQTCENK